MRKLFVLLLAVCLVVPVLAQDDKPMAQEDAAQEMGPPPALDNDFMNWMVGQWEGTDKSPMGEGKVTMACEMGLDGQFMLTNYKSESEMGMFKGMGTFTINETGGIKGFWIDNMRTMAKGKGTRDGDKVTMVWKGGMGTMTRTTEKVSDDKMLVTYVFDGPQGKVEGKEELTRVKKMTDKSY